MHLTFFLFAFLISAASISAAGVGYVLTPVLDMKNVRIFDYKVANTLKCNISAPLKSDLEMRWAKNDMIIEKNEEKYDIRTDSIVIFRTVEDDIATYACIIVNKTDNRHITRAEIRVMGKPTAKILQKVPQGASIEGQKILLECVSQGNPLPDMEWRFNNQTFRPDDSSNDPSKKSEGRVKVTQKTENTLTLQIDEAQMSDRGTFVCVASNEASQILNHTAEATIFLRVKDKLAALWPFIGICAEVIVLCAIILVYERNRIKSEMEESDTDVSPEQKNTPDHGKESVRQRK